MERRRYHDPDPIWQILSRVERRPLRWLAECTGWSTNTLKGYSAGQKRPSRRFCDAAALAMGYDVKELFRNVKQHNNRGPKPASMRKHDG